MAVTTTIFNQVQADESRKLGSITNGISNDVPKEAQLLAYRAAEWGAFAFGILGKALCVSDLAY